MVVGLTSSFSKTSRSRELDLLVLRGGTRTLASRAYPGEINVVWRKTSLFSGR